MQQITTLSNQKSYNLQLQVIVDHRIYFLMLGMPGSLNDVKVLQLSSIYQKATWGNIFHNYFSHKGIKPYIKGTRGVHYFNC